ncbi:hypothetical protein C0Q70_06995 [Pomacea canaliculata]|uniref:Uncharacterized protein n=1 Tax=Pomacea canaliculata TaxID=400727 RepID=A0A2T7PDU1_POMCA|nr:hypothetical protein C0Q70_06995 [Pomacea canaliculata]
MHQTQNPSTPNPTPHPHTLRLSLLPVIHGLAIYPASCMMKGWAVFSSSRSAVNCEDRSSRQHDSIPMVDGPGQDGGTQESACVSAQSAKSQPGIDVVELASYPPVATPHPDSRLCPDSTSQRSTVHTSRRGQVPLRTERQRASNAARDDGRQTTELASLAARVVVDGHGARPSASAGLGGKPGDDIMLVHGFDDGEVHSRGLQANTMA